MSQKVGVLSLIFILFFLSGCTVLFLLYGDLVESTVVALITITYWHTIVKIVRPQ